MFIRVVPPRPELQRYVKVFAYHEGFVADYEVIRYLPDGGLQIIIDLTDEPKYIVDDATSEPSQRCVRAWVSGMRTEYLSIGAGSVSTMFVIEFQAGETGPVFGFPLSRIADCVIDADSVFGQSIDDVRQRLLNCETVEKKFEEVENWLLDRVRTGKQDSGLVSFAARRIRRDPTMASVDEIARLAGVSNKHLIKSFKDVIGITPKQYQRVHRFQKVITQIEASEEIEWAQLALECGFYDQAHFANEFKRFSGFNPTKYLIIKSDEINWIPTA